MKTNDEKNSKNDALFCTKSAIASPFQKNKQHRANCSMIMSCLRGLYGWFAI